jgi:uncharacterized protein DUF3806
MELEIRALTIEEEEARREALQMAARLVGGTPPLTVREVGELYIVLRDQYPDFLEGQIAVGIAFGELIAANSGYEWIRVTDEHGSETALSPPGLQGCCHPISMMQKRIKERADIDIAQTINATIQVIEERVRSGQWAARKSADMH